jgi:hypothetical protein
LNAQEDDDVDARLTAPPLVVAAALHAAPESIMADILFQEQR